MNKTVLITGGLGFLGRSVANTFNSKNYEVFGLGHGNLNDLRWKEIGYKDWKEGDISYENLIEFDRSFDIIVHCANDVSVYNSIQDPLKNYESSIQITQALISFIQQSSKSPHLIFPSSAAVYGDIGDMPIKEDSIYNPISPYGKNKLLSEKLLKKLSQEVDMKLSIIRFFSIYGPGQKKQLLWDAYEKLTSNSSQAIFFGTGEETRDWIYIEDASRLILHLSEMQNPPFLINGASGIRMTLKNSLNLLKNSIGTDKKLVFDGKIRAGDPAFYHADISRLLHTEFKNKFKLQEGIKQYVEWCSNQ